MYAYIYRLKARVHRHTQTYADIHRHMQTYTDIRSREGEKT